MGEGGAPDGGTEAGAIKEAVEGQGAEGYSFHGLRKNAAKRLAEMDCTDAQIMAITGHRTRAMVTKYTCQANQRKMAKAAIHKLDFGNDS